MGCWNGARRVLRRPIGQRPRVGIASLGPRFLEFHGRAGGEREACPARSAGRAWAPSRPASHRNPVRREGQALKGVVMCGLVGGLPLENRRSVAPGWCNHSIRLMSGSTRLAGHSANEAGRLLRPNGLRRASVSGCRGTKAFPFCGSQPGRRADAATKGFSPSGSNRPPLNRDSGPVGQRAPLDVRRLASFCSSSSTSPRYRYRQRAAR